MAEKYMQEEKLFNAIDELDQAELRKNLNDIPGNYERIRQVVKYDENKGKEKDMYNKIKNGEVNCLPEGIQQIETIAKDSKISNDDEMVAVCINKLENMERIGKEQVYGNAEKDWEKVLSKFQRFRLKHNSEIQNTNKELAKYLYGKRNYIKNWIDTHLEDPKIKTVLGLCKKVDLKKYGEYLKEKQHEAKNSGKEKEMERQLQKQNNNVTSLSGAFPMAGREKDEEFESLRELGPIYRDAF